ncbi:MAG: BlaI/MecI/CopY family transcriptional regulator [Planctomycetota bacterium]
MPRSESEHPTELELEILKVLWDDSPLLVRDIRSRLAEFADRELAHSSVVTMLNIMHRKGFVRRRKEGKAFLYAPKAQRDRVVNRMMKDMLSKLFDDSPAALMLSLLESTDVGADEIAELRKLIAKKAKENKS